MPSGQDIFAGIRLPVICAPMFLVSYPELILAACKSNIAAACSASTARSASEYGEWLDHFDDELTTYRKHSGRPTGPYAANISLRTGKVGARERFEAEVLACKNRRVRLLITINGAPGEIVQEVHGWGGMIFHDVTTIRHAEKAAAVGVDGMILICSGGGGHSGGLNPFAFVSAVRKFFDGYIVLAGGITTGEHIRAAEALGADLCYMGTRFIATKEARASSEYKEIILTSRAEDLVYTPFFTHGIPANMLAKSVRRVGYDPHQLPVFGTEKPHEHAKPWRDVWAAGQGVELINDIPPVATLVDRLAAEYNMPPRRRQPLLDRTA
ncbi:NAD(P)H-dependent flavin oxidoreductase [Microvirga puerhi]|uniref:Nitronate monooxygenase family protein n=1 Tax=Microvirga puerhi TaxID=2876078 RepID=A0ABS7VSD9_9HYPH|nr:nitronate monooxygenase family protein [Microvirga puerhi]MBZ6078469.1 nitronate monooxygenase family protein [Microvirga puerhi]